MVEDRIGSEGGVTRTQHPAFPERHGARTVVACGVHGYDFSATDIGDRVARLDLSESLERRHGGTAFHFQHVPDLRILGAEADPNAINWEKYYKAGVFNSG